MKLTHTALALGISSSILSGTPALAKGKVHAAHEHGAAKLNLLVEGTKLTAEFEVPSESIYGFEYEPKTDFDKKKREAGGEKLKSNIDKMIILDAKLGCKFTTSKLDLHAEETDETDAKKSKDPKEKAKHDAEHSETHAKFIADCKSPLAGTKATFGFSKVFSAIHGVKVQVLSGEKQSGLEVEKDKGSVDL